jgi:hypothetical protein
LWIQIRIGSGTNDIEDPDLESGSIGKKNEGKPQDNFLVNLFSILQQKRPVVDPDPD